MSKILITGGTGVVGRILVDFFYKKGWRVFFTSTSQEKIDSLMSSLPELNERFMPQGFLVDFLLPESLENFISQIVNVSGEVLDYIVHNARSMNNLRANTSGLCNRDDFMNEFLINVVTPYEISTQLFNFVKIKSIVNVGSMYGIVAANKGLYKNYPDGTFINYGVSKAGLMHLTKELGVRFAERGVRVNCVAFGGIEGRVDADFTEAYSKLSPSGRMLQSREISGPIEFLLDDSSSSMTGQTIICDGGWTLW